MGTVIGNMNVLKMSKSEHMDDERAQECFTCFCL